MIQTYNQYFKKRDIRCNHGLFVRQVVGGFYAALVVLVALDQQHRGVRHDGSGSAGGDRGI